MSLRNALAYGSKAIKNIEKKEKEVEIKEKRKANLEKELKEMELHEKKELQIKDSDEKFDVMLQESLNIYKSVYKDIKVKFPDIDLEFFIERLNSDSIREDDKKSNYLNIGSIIESLYHIDLKSLNYNKYIAYKLLKNIESIVKKDGYTVVNEISLYNHNNATKKYANENLRNNTILNFKYN